MQTFRKQERLCHKKAIELLFSEGKKIKSYPFLLFYRCWKSDEEQDHNSKFPAQILFSVSRKRIRNTVDRNFLKRRMREVYRLNKSQLYDFLKQQKWHGHFGIIFIGKDLCDYHTIELKIKKLLKRLEKEYEEGGN